MAHALRGAGTKVAAGSGDVGGRHRLLADYSSLPGESVESRTRRKPVHLALYRLFALEINLRTIALNSIRANFVIVALHLSLPERPGWLPPAGTPAGGRRDLRPPSPPRRPPNGPSFSLVLPTCAADFSEGGHMSESDATYFMLGFAAGMALLWVVTETIWMRL